MDASDVDTGAANVEKSREETDVSDVRDLAHCGELTDKGLLQELKLRYQQNDIYVSNYTKWLLCSMLHVCGTSNCLTVVATPSHVIITS